MGIQIFIDLTPNELKELPCQRHARWCGYGGLIYDPLATGAAGAGQDHRKVCAQGNRASVHGS